MSWNEGTYGYASFGPEGWSSIKGFMRKGIEEGWSTSTLQSTLQSAGLGYRRQNLLEDYRKVEMTSRTRVGNLEAEESAISFFENKVEPYRQAYGLTLDQALSNYKKYRDKEYETLEEAEELEAIGEEYEWDTTP